MKKHALVTLSALALVGCSSGGEQEITKSVESNQTIVKESKEEVLPAVELPTEEKGEGSIELFNASGSTENSEPIVIFYDKEVIQDDFDIMSIDFDSSLLSYVYVDNVEVTKEQLGEMSQVSVDVPNSILSKPGLHTVTIVQYPDDDTTQEPVTVKIQQIEVKPK